MADSRPSSTSACFLVSLRLAYSCGAPLYQRVLSPQPRASSDPESLLVRPRPSFVSTASGPLHQRATASSPQEHMWSSTTVHSSYQVLHVPFFVSLAFFPLAAGSGFSSAETGGGRGFPSALNTPSAATLASTYSSPYRREIWSARCLPRRGKNSVWACGASRVQQAFLRSCATIPIQQYPEGTFVYGHTHRKEKITTATKLMFLNVINHLG